MILKKLSTRTCYRLGKLDGFMDRDPVPPPEHPKAYREGHGKGCVQPREERARRSIWANAVLVAEIARLRRRLLVEGDSHTKKLAELRTRLDNATGEQARWRELAESRDLWCPKVLLQWNCRFPAEDGVSLGIRITIPRGSMHYSDMPRGLISQAVNSLRNKLLDMADKGEFADTRMREVSFTIPENCGW